MEQVDGRPPRGRLAKRCRKVPGNATSCTLIAAGGEKVEQQRSRWWEVCQYQRPRGLRCFVAACLAKQRLVWIQLCCTACARAFRHRLVLSAMLRRVVRAGIGGRYELREEQQQNGQHGTDAATHCAAAWGRNAGRRRAPHVRIIRLPGRPGFGCTILLIGSPRTTLETHA